MAQPLPDRERYVRWATSDPVGWMAKVLQERLSPIQTSMAEAVRDHERVAVRSCHGSGKTNLAGKLALHWVAADRGSLAILTGPTFRQVIENSWGELVRSHKPVANLIGGHLAELQGRLRMGPRWGVLAFATDNPVNLSGFHAARVLVIVDEASGVEASLFDALEGVLSSGHTRLLLLSQGTSPTGPFYDAFHKDRQLWRTVVISAFDTPNFQPDVLREWLGRDPGFMPETPLAEKAQALQAAWEASQPTPGYRWPVPYLVNPAWACRLGAKDGLNSDPYVVKVLGGFARGDPHALLQLFWMERARALILPPSTDPKTWMGLDVAYQGDDDSAYLIRRGPNALRYEEWHGHDTVDTAGRAWEAVVKYGVTDVNVDVVGVGAGVRDQLQRLASERGVRVHPINAGEKARDPERFVNFGAEMLWGLRERFEANQCSLIALEHDAHERMTGELTGRLWSRNARGQIVIEPKEQFKKRLGHSPDAGDAVALAFAVPNDELAVFTVDGDDSDPFDDDW